MKISSIIIGLTKFLTRKLSITTVLVALFTTVALVAGHIIFVSAINKDKTALILITGVLMTLSWIVAWILPRIISRSLEGHSEILHDLMMGGSNKNDDDYDSDTFISLAETVNEVFWVSDPTGIKMQYVSPAFEKIWGRPIEKLEEQEKTWIDTIQNGDKEKVLKILDKMKKEPFSIEHRITRSDGATRWIRTKGFPIVDSRGKVTSLVGISEDITDSKIIEIAKTEFVSLASHQLRTPLSTLKWALEVMGESTENFSDTQMRLLQNAQAAMVRMGETINAMLSASRIQSEQITPQAKTIGIQRILEKVQETYRVQCRKKQQICTMECPDDLQIFTDENMFVEIMSNLLSNAIHYTKEKGEIRIEAKKDKNNKHAVIQVTDSGIGIPLEDQPMLFSKLFRSKNAKLMDTNGTGLGLYVTKSLVNVLNGQIYCSSEENKGTTFSIHLPLAGATT